MTPLAKAAKAARMFAEALAEMADREASLQRQADFAREGLVREGLVPATPPKRAKKKRRAPRAGPTPADEELAKKALRRVGARGG